jgi:hypothetical protein
MDQLSMPLREKIDQPLAELFNNSELSDSARIPVIVRCDRNAVPEIADQVIDLGGSIRHTLLLIGAIAAWIPITSVAKLANSHAVKMLELEQTFTVA